jgi:hypothetical protein
MGAFRCSLVLAAAALACPLAIAAQPGSAAVAGRVFDAQTREPIAGAVLQLVGRNRFVETDSAGAFRLGGLDPQLVSVRIFHSGYGSVQRSLNLFAGRTVAVEYLLTPEATRLAEVRIEARPEATPTARVLEGFEERRRLGAGTFFDQETLERWTHRRMGDILRGVPSVRLITSGSTVVAATNRQGVRSFGRGGGPCYLDVIVDGMRIGGSNSAPPNLNGLVSVSELIGVEIYPGLASVPAVYRTPGNMCGAIMFWTRRGWGKGGAAGERPPPATR